ncbi:hypothetical protein VN12_25985 [Pirellula sp. SH-Sr6A]|uniref:hypothetical protein n=1 Tax=Pirellula sp. SH-Sr6A TaxID=1632865 RepID=UPI00078D2C0C|nr:hypothetical protein [Pirellula sp. SH-Sr6A]AMV35569.1 hypothetical protein VN12_25985 [Pirellula sp. SH-Sr6A]
MIWELNFTRRATGEARGVYSLAVVFFLFQLVGCGVLRPDPIVRHRNNLPSDLIADEEPMLERGKKRPIIDAFGWVWGIPSKILFWNRRIESHSISPETELLLQDYLIENDLVDVKVRLNQYRPLDDWRRLTRNKSVAWPWRYTFGAVATLGETVIPGRLFGGDHYNPYTATIHLYSDVPAIAYHEGAHAKDFSNREYPGTYAALYVLPIVPLWHERTATNDVLAYVRDRGDPQSQREAMHVLYPAYGTYVGNAAGTLLPTASTPLYLASVIAGHVAARREAP